jgi:hypothetical protein
MANYKISQLPTASVITGSELVELVQGGVSVQSTVTDITISSSYSQNAKSASWAPYTDTGTTLYTASTYQITASWANNAISASWAVCNATTLFTGSTYPITASSAVSASWAPFTDTGTTLYTGSTYEITASSAISASWAFCTATSLVTGSTYPITASWANNAISASWAACDATTLYTGSTYPITASSAVSASWAPFTDTGTTLYTGSTYQITASWARDAISASWAVCDATTLYTASTYQITASSAISASWAPGASLTGTDNYFPIWSSNTLTATSSIYQSGSGAVGIGNTTPTARLHLASGSTALAPLKFTSGPLLSPSDAGSVEFLTDDYYATITTATSSIPSGYASQYPPAHSDTYVKATTTLGAGSEAFQATNPANTLTGSGAQWYSANGSQANQRFHIDLGSAKTILRVYYENGHVIGTATDRGAKNFTFWGSNTGSAFADTTYATDTNWTQLPTSSAVFDQHVALDQADPKYFTVTNTTAYRYYAFKFADTYGGSFFMTVRRIELQTGVYAGDRKGIVLNDGATLTSGSVPIVTTNGRLTNGLTLTGTILNVTASNSVSASWSAPQGATTLFTGSTYQITASWANNAISASWAVCDATTLYTASTYQITASSAISASWATSASYAPVSNLFTNLTASQGILVGPSSDTSGVTLYISASNRTGNIVEIDDGFGSECFILNNTGSLTLSSSGLFPLRLYNNINNESEFFNANLNAGNTASTDTVCFNNLGNTASYTAQYYIDMGINSSGYTYPFIGGANDAYLFSSGSGQSKLYIGQIDSVGTVYLFAGGTVNTGSGLIVKGSSVTSTQPFTASVMFGTASNATSASTAITANSASCLYKVSGSGAWTVSVEPTYGDLVFNYS